MTFYRRWPAAYGLSASVLRDYRVFFDNRWPWFLMAWAAFLCARVSVPWPVEHGPWHERFCHVFSLQGCLGRDPRGLLIVIGPRDGKASIALPKWRRRAFLRLACHPAAAIKYCAVLQNGR
jgi:hypothetical protein